MPGTLRYQGYLLSTLVLALLCTATSDAARGRRASIDAYPNSLTWDGEYKCEASDLLIGEHCAVFPLPTAPEDSVNGSMVLKIGSKLFTHVWVSRNGFIALGESAATTPANYSADVSELKAVSGDIIAPFYAPIQLRPYEDDNVCSFNCIEDLTYASINVRDAENPENDGIGFRATWGLFPKFASDPPDPERLPGVSMVDAADPSKRNTFQVWLIDREPTTHRSGDFDIHFNYSGVTWEAAPTLVGIKSGPANNPEVLLDFAKFYGTFLDDNPDVTLERAAECANGSDSLVSTRGSFDTSWALGCNTITIQFRDGKPNLESYTSDLSVTLASDSNAPPPHSAVAHPMTLTISNGDFDKATQIKAKITLPAGVTLVSTPADVCDQDLTVATCTLGELAAHTSMPVALSIQSTQSGPKSISATVFADQFDQDLSGNSSVPTEVAFADSADLSITGCVHPASVQVEGSATVTCTVRNDGPQAADQVELSATLPSNVTFTSGTGCAVSANTLSCTTASLASGATIDFSATLKTVSTGNVAISANVQSQTFDPVANTATVASFNIASKPIPMPKPKSGSLSLETLLALLGLTILTARRRFKAG